MTQDITVMSDTVKAMSWKSCTSRTSDGEGDGLILYEKHDLISHLQNQLKLNSRQIAKYVF